MIINKTLLFLFAAFFLCSIGAFFDNFDADRIYDDVDMLKA